ncbi:MAG: 50S ribosomal protein L13 [Muribaculaceae bacterium]|nr:50S ribosomal protein L13 [Muribaculaceae bacterium]
MDTISYRTEFPNAQQVEHQWVVIDATDQVLGRLCAKVAKLLRGKYKPSYSPNMECGDNVIIINADKIVLTGKKMTDRVYLSYTGYPGGQRETTPEVLMKKSFKQHNQEKGMHPLFMQVMKGMLPKNRLGRRLIENMHVYNGPNHPHEAQNPTVIDINKLK